MERLRRSLRKSFRFASGDGGRKRSNKPDSWNEDDVGVRSGKCSFAVKYLGCVEVHESRGMQVCEEAMKSLRQSRQRPIRGVLYISGDGLRVVDAENKGLAVDQTIEKVSFCAPDRNHERGFAYICREGTTRRWMCHGFHAIHESGERLSHAVGCAFAVCLEKKQRRDRDIQILSSANSASQSCVSPMLNGNTSGSTSIGLDPAAQTSFKRDSFRYLSLRDRLCDPQFVKPSEPPPLKVTECPYAIARPHANKSLFERQASLRIGAADTIASNTFRRFNSLRLSNNLSGGIVRPIQPSGPEPILEEDAAEVLSCTGNSENALMMVPDGQSNSLQNCAPVTTAAAVAAGTSPSTDLCIASSVAAGNIAPGTGKGEQWLMSLSCHVKPIGSCSSPSPPPPPTAFNETTSVYRSVGVQVVNGDQATAKQSTLTVDNFDPFEARWNALSPKPEMTNPFLYTSSFESSFDKH